MATITVTNTNDSGDGSLRAAILQAQQNGTRADKIVFDTSLAGQTINLQTKLEIDSSLTINGDVDNDGKADITLSGQNKTRIIDIEERIFLADTNVTIRSLTITGGNSDEGAGIYSRNFGELNIINSTISNCSADYGAGGLYAGYNGGNVRVVNSLFTGNSAGEYGGAIRNNANSMVLVNTTITGNTSVKSGGAGILLEAGKLVLINSTVTGNHANKSGASGIIAGDFARLTLVNSVVADNTSGIAGTEIDIFTFGGITKATNSIFGTDVNILAGGGNLENAGDIGLGELLDNGGAVLTLSPLDGSVLIGFGNNSLLPRDVFDLDGDGITNEALPFDARLLARIIGDVVDVGAVEQTADEIIFGTLGKDEIAGGEGRDFLVGLDGNDRITGGKDRDLIVGGLGNDTLQGGGEHDSIKAGNGNDMVIGGSARDKLAGGTGSDGFVLANHSASQDEVVDFVSGTDQLRLLSNLFGNLPEGTLNARLFVANSTGVAEGKNDHFVYNTQTGELFFDSNGSGAGGSESIAVFSNIPVLLSSDFQVI